MLQRVAFESFNCRFSWRCWVILSGTATISTFGLCTAVFVLLRGNNLALWPWRHTETTLLASLSLLVPMLVLYLTYQQKNYQRVLHRASEEKRGEIERRIRADRRFSLLKETLDNVSHEFRTPLTIIKEYASGAKEALAAYAESQVHEFLDIIVSCADDLARMVNDLLDVSRIERNILSMSRKRCRLDSIVQRVSRALERRARSGDVQLTVAIDATCPEVFCDAEKIGRVIINLAVNAIKFSPPGGHVWITAQPEIEEAQVRVSVKDEGPGIPPDERQRIFERFQRLSTEKHTSTNGFGLGLSIVKELVDLSLGHVTVESEVGRGSTFSFTIPTPDPTALLKRYFGRASRFRQEARHFALLRIVASSAIDPDDSADLERFLETQLRRSDLLMKSRWNQWHLVVPADREGAAALTNRLATTQREALPRRCLDAAGDVRFEIVDVCRAGDDCNRIIAAVASTPDSGEPKVDGETAQPEASIPSMGERAHR